MYSNLTQTLLSASASEQKRAKKAFLVVKIFAFACVVIFAGLVYAAIIPLSAGSIAAGIMIVSVGSGLLYIPVNLSKSRLVRLAIEGVSREIAGNPWRYWGAYDIMPFRPKGFGVFPFFRRIDTTYFLHGIYKSAEVWITSALVRKKVGQKTFDSRYTFDGHVFVISNIQHTENIIITNANPSDYFGIPRRFTLASPSGAVPNEQVYLSNAKAINSNDLNRFRAIFAKLYAQTPIQLLLKVEKGEMTLAIADQKTFFEQSYNFAEEKPVEDCINDVEVAIRYFIEIMDCAFLK